MWFVALPNQVVEKPCEHSVWVRLEKILMFVDEPDRASPVVQQCFTCASPVLHFFGVHHFVLQLCFTFCGAT